MLAAAPDWRALMCVKVLLADDAEVIRRAIRNLLKNREDIKIVGEAEAFPEVLQKTTELKPDVIVLDLHMRGEWCFSTQFPDGHKLLAISFANDDEAKELADSIGAAKLLDKMELSQTLIPAILELAPSQDRYTLS
jgi:DNA-binding NarL/FixJ family response regulator